MLTPHWSPWLARRFYLVFPAILLALNYKIVIKPAASAADTKTDAEAGLSDSATPEASYFSFLVLAACASLSLVITVAGSMLAIQEDQEMSSRWSNYVFYLMPFRFWQLASGALLFQLLDTYHEWVSSKVNRLGGSQVIAWVAPVVFGFGYALDSGSSSAIVQLAWAFATVYATCSFILAGALADPLQLPFFNAACSFEPVKYIGKISYQLYLFHWPAILYSKRLAETLQPMGAFDEICVVVFGLFFGVGLPLFSYHIMEYPLRSWRHKGVLHSLLVVSTMLALIVGICIWVGQLRGPLGKEMITASMPPIQAPESAQVAGSTPQLFGSSPSKSQLSGAQTKHTKVTPPQPDPSQSSPPAPPAELPFVNQQPFSTTCPDRAIAEWQLQNWDAHWTSDDWGSKTQDTRFIAEGFGNLSTPTSYGRAHATDSPCACRPCGMATAIKPKGIAPDDDATHGTCMHYTGNVDSVCLRGCCDPMDLLVGHGMSDATDKIRGCLTPDRDSPYLPKRTMFVIGDSHSANLATTLLLAVRGRYQIRNFHIYGTGVVPGTRIANDLIKGNADAVALQNQVFETLASAAQEGDIVVHQAMSSDMLSMVGVESEDIPWDDQQKNLLKAYWTQLKDAMQPILAKGAKMLVVGDWCMGGPSAGDPPIVENFLEQEVKNEVGGSIFQISLYSLLLDNGECSGKIPGTPYTAYSDAPENNHITGDTATYMWPFVCDALSELGLMSPDPS